MKKILLISLLAGGVQNSFAMGSCGGGAAQGGGQAAESGFRLEGRIPVIFSDGSVVYLDLQRLKALNSWLLEGMLFTEEGLSRLGEFSEDNTLVMQEFTNLEDFENFETALKRPLQGEIADMVDFFKKADFLRINTDDNLKGLFVRDEAQFVNPQFVNLCLALLAENPGFVFNMQRVYPEILHEAIRTKNFDFAKMLIDSGADVKVINWQGMTALIWAAEFGYTEMVQLLIAAHVDVNASDNDGMTALMWAAIYGYREIARLLIAAGADVDAINDVGMTALMWAAVGPPSLMLAAENGYPEIARLLIGAGADVNFSANNGLTALMNAASDGHTEIILLLIAAGADVNAINSDGETALMIATRYHRTEIAKLLRDAGTS